MAEIAITIKVIKDVDRCTYAYQRCSRNITALLFYTFIFFARRTIFFLLTFNFLIINVQSEVELFSNKL